MKKSSLVIGLIAFTFFLSITQRVIAQTESNTPLKLTAIPARLGDEDYSLSGKPGQLIQTTVQVKNTSDQVQQIFTQVEDFTIGEDGEKPVPTTEETKWNLAKWMTLSSDTQTLKPSEVGEVNISIQVPLDAVPGGRYAMVMHSPLKTDLANQSGSGISQRVGTLVYFVVEGEIHEEAYLRDIQKDNFFEFGPVPFSFTLENRSDIHLHPSIQVEISNMLGKKVDTFGIESKNIFPGQSRKFPEHWNRVWGLGKYTAVITASYGTQGKTVTGSFSFWMIPLRVILGGVFGVVLFIAMAILLKRKISDDVEVRAEEKRQLDKKVNKKSQSLADQFKDEHH